VLEREYYWLAQCSISSPCTSIFIYGLAKWFNVRRDFAVNDLYRTDGSAVVLKHNFDEYISDSFSLLGIDSKLSVVGVTDNMEDFAAKLERARAQSAEVIEGRVEAPPPAPTDLRLAPAVPDRRFRR
jgi:hypothetical protein